MKVVTFFAFLLATAAALPAESRTSYSGHKVFRVPVLDDGTYIQNLIDQLHLSVWQPPSKKGAFADVQVPPSQIGAFEKAMTGRNFEVMHEDLGNSIAEEGVFQAYGGKY
jgi:hypothetical protein